MFGDGDSQTHMMIVLTIAALLALYIHSSTLTATTLVDKVEAFENDFAMQSASTYVPSSDKTIHITVKIDSNKTVKNNVMPKKRVLPTKSTKMSRIDKRSNLLVQSTMNTTDVWKLLENRYGHLRAQIFMPETWVLTNDRDHADMLKAVNSGDNPNQVFVLKMNADGDAKRALRIVKSFDASTRNYDFCQRILERPYLISGYMTSLRMYLLVVKKNTSVSVYIYRNGSVYYSPMKYVAHSLEASKVVTACINDMPYSASGSSDSSGSSRSSQFTPFTYQEFLGHVEVTNGHGSSRFLQSNIDYLVHGLLDAYKHSLSQDNSSYIVVDGKNESTAELLTLDIQVNDSLDDPKLLSVRAGITDRVQNHRNTELKSRLVNDISEIVTFNNDSNHINALTNGFDLVETFDTTTLNAEQ